MEEDEGYELDDAEDGEFVEQLDPMSRKLMGISEPIEDEDEEDEELDEEEDEAVLDEAAEAGARPSVARRAQAAPSLMHGWLGCTMSCR